MKIQEALDAQGIANYSGYRTVIKHSKETARDYYLLFTQYIPDTACLPVDITPPVILHTYNDVRLYVTEGIENVYDCAGEEVPDYRA